MKAQKSIDKSTRLPSGDYNLKVRQQVQNRHISGTKEHLQYIEKLSEKGIKPSVLSAGIDVAELVNKFHGKGIYDPNPKDNSPREIVNTDKVIGQYWNNRTGQYEDTAFIEIVYSKKGVHIYPVRPLEEK